MLHMRPIQCFICDLPNASYVCSISKARYVVYSVLHVWPTQCFRCDLFDASCIGNSKTRSVNIDLLILLMWPRAEVTFTHHSTCLPIYSPFYCSPPYSSPYLLAYLLLTTLPTRLPTFSATYSFAYPPAYSLQNMLHATRSNIHAP